LSFLLSGFFGCEAYGGALWIEYWGGRYDFGDFVEVALGRIIWSMRIFMGSVLRLEAFSRNAHWILLLAGLDNIFSINRRIDPNNLFVPSEPKIPKAFLGFIFHLIYGGAIWDNVYIVLIVPNKILSQVTPYMPRTSVLTGIPL